MRRTEAEAGPQEPEWSEKGKDLAHERSSSAKRKFVLSLVLVLALAAWAGVWYWKRASRDAALREPAGAAIAQLNGLEEATRLLGIPISGAGKIEGSIGRDPFGYEYTRLNFAVRGALGNGVVEAVGAKSSGSWVFSWLSVELGDHRTLNAVTGALFDASGRVLRVPSVAQGKATYSGKHPCVFATLEHDGSMHTQLGECETPTGLSSGPVDRFEVDLRYGSFVVRETDLYVKDVFDVPLTRTYTSADWMHTSARHAFGLNANHPFDIAPVGTSNPYTWQAIVMEDSDWFMFERISPGKTYGDVVYRHTLTSTRFYGATQQWNGTGWTTELADGSRIEFPESYRALSAAYGAPTEMRDPAGNRLKMKRDEQRNLKEITTPNGHWIRFTYDGAGRIRRAEDDQKNRATYTYDARGLLEWAIRPDGTRRGFSYQGRKATAVWDGNDRALVRNTYSGDVVVKQQFANGETYIYDYDWPKGDFARSVMVTLPNGRKTKVSVAESVPAYVKGLK